VGRGNGAKEHQLHRGAKLVLAGLFDCTDDAEAGIVDQHVDATEALDRRRDGGSYLLGTSDVDVGEQHALGRSRGQLCERRRLASGRHHRVAALERFLRDGSSETGGRTGNEPDLSLYGVVLGYAHDDSSCWCGRSFKPPERSR
jgi:hypothetical protein